MTQPETGTVKSDAKAFAIEAARLMNDLKCEQTMVIDVKGLSKVTDYIVIATGTSQRQMYSVGEDVAELAESMGHPVFRSNQERSSNWVVIDCVDVTLHLLEENMRAFYDLETLWIEGERLPWQRGESG